MRRKRLNGECAAWIILASIWVGIISLPFFVHIEVDRAVQVKCEALGEVSS